MEPVTFDYGTVKFTLTRHHDPLNMRVTFLLHVQYSGEIKQLYLVVDEHYLAYMPEHELRDLLFKQFVIKLPSKLDNCLQGFLMQVGKHDTQKTLDFYFMEKNPAAEIKAQKAVQYRQPEVDKLPGMRKQVKHPETGTIQYLEYIIISLNDKFGWSRDRIADWLETLDIDLRFREDGQYDSDESSPPTTLTVNVETKPMLDQLEAIKAYHNIQLAYPDKTYQDIKNLWITGGSHED